MQASFLSTIGSYKVSMIHYQTMYILKIYKNKTVQNSSAQQGCETSVQKEKQYKAGFVYSFIAPCWCQSVPNPLQNLLQTLILRCFVLMWYTLLVAYSFNRLTVFQVSAKDNTRTEIHGKNSSTMDFAYSRVDCVDDCCCSSEKGIIYFLWVVDIRKGLNYIRDLIVRVGKHWNKLSPALEDFENRWAECLPKDGVPLLMALKNLGLRPWRFSFDWYYDVNYLHAVRCFFLSLGEVSFLREQFSGIPHVM